MTGCRFPSRRPADGLRSTRTCRGITPTGQHLQLLRPRPAPSAQHRCFSPPPPLPPNGQSSSRCRPPACKPYSTEPYSTVPSCVGTPKPIAAAQIIEFAAPSGSFSRSRSRSASRRAPHWGHTVAVGHTVTQVCPALGTYCGCARCLHCLPPPPLCAACAWVDADTHHPLQICLAEQDLRAQLEALQHGSARAGASSCVCSWPPSPIPALCGRVSSALSAEQPRL